MRRSGTRCFGVSSSGRWTTAAEADAYASLAFQTAIRSGMWLKRPDLAPLAGVDRQGARALGPGQSRPCASLARAINLDGLREGRNRGVRAVGRARRRRASLVRVWCSRRCGGASRRMGRGVDAVREPPTAGGGRRGPRSPVRGLRVGDPACGRPRALPRGAAPGRPARRGLRPALSSPPPPLGGAPRGDRREHRRLGGRSCADGRRRRRGGGERGHPVRAQRAHAHRVRYCSRRDRRRAHRGRAARSCGRLQRRGLEQLPRPAPASLRPRARRS